MTIFESIKLMNIDELAKWFKENYIHDDYPVIAWWDKNYCKKCEPEIARILEDNREIECAWCELHDKCKFFQDMDNIPTSKEMIKMWLESELA